MRHNAFSLLELTVAMAMGATIAAAGLSAFGNFNRQRARLERAVVADETAKVVVQYLVRETQRVGGPALRPWQALAVEQDPCTISGGIPCLAGDRLTFAFPDDDALFSACGIKELTDDTIQLQEIPHPDLGTQCCNLLRVVDGAVTVAAVSSLRNTHLMLSSTGIGGSNTERFRAITLADSLGGDTANCRFRYINSAVVRPLSSTCDAGSAGCGADGRPSNRAFSGAPGAFISIQGNAIPISVATAYIGCTTDTGSITGSCADAPENRGLFLFSDRNAGASTSLSIDDDDDNFVVSPNIVDLQVALGYDTDGDGEILEARDGIDDDYVGNRDPPPGDVRPPPDRALPPGETAEDPSLLRMLSIGVMAAVKVNDDTYISTAKLPGQQPLEARGLHLRSLVSKAAFRSLNLLE